MIFLNGLGCVLFLLSVTFLLILLTLRDHADLGIKPSLPGAQLKHIITNIIGKVTPLYKF
jgi:hypothetical protein